MSLPDTPRPRRSRRRSSARILVALLAALIFVLAACGDDDDDEGSSATTVASTGQSVRITSQDFPENKTLAEVYGQFLETKGFDVEVQRPIGTRTQIFDALKADDVDLVIDYAGSAAAELDPDGTASSDAGETYDRLTAALEGTGLVAAQAAEAEDANALVALRSWAEENDITSISDLAGRDDVVFGGAAECSERPDCLPGYEDPEIYGITFADKKVVDYGPPLVEALKAGTITVAQYQTTAPQIGDELVVLEDDEGLLSADNIVPILREDAATDELLAALDELSAQITTEDLIAWNKATDVEKEESADVAEFWLKAKGLI